MSSHLSNQNISAWIAGERPLEWMNHLRGCEECQAEVARCEATLTQFRGCVRRWSDERFNPMTQVSLQRRQAPSPIALWKVWCAVALLMLCLTATFVMQRGAQQPVTVGSANADDVLLKQLDQEVSRTVPAPMEPLMQLVSWDGKTNQAGNPKMLVGRQTERE